jgi:cytoskeletal protein RodZ
MGAILRAERERKGLEITDLAHQLNLRSSFISAMEDGHGDDHMPWVYERIHQRTVAHLLGISVGSDS